LQAQSKFSKAHNELNKLKLKLFKFSFWQVHKYQWNCSRLSHAFENFDAKRLLGAECNR